ncbi:WhiB family transcriptional regulator [Streptomyces sp. NPDC088097]|uniref:WhiB family transcriptional regulator n=1 Tax=Streptomyces sp. NPDC088097 TaxID=3365823 RepID=UPI003830E224
MKTLPMLVWKADATCAQSDPESFFPERGHSIAAVKRVCAVCPVLDLCRDYALTHGEQHGVWGGLSERERRALRAGTKTAPEEAGRDYSEVDAYIRAGELGDTDIARLCDLPNSTVHTRRALLGLSPNSQQRTPLEVFAEMTRSVGDGHREWTGPANVIWEGRHLAPTRIAFLAGHGREAAGHVRVTCGHKGCVAPAHLADRELRDAWAAA